MNIEKYIENIFKIQTEKEFNAYALELFEYQYKNNNTYRDYVQLIYNEKLNISHYSEIPFLPIDFFRSKKILSTNDPCSHIFFSSGTTANNRSKHYIKDLDLYKKSINYTFKYFFSDPTNFIFLCLTPDFKDNPNSSLSFMCNELILKSKNKQSGFFLNKEDKLKKVISNCQKNNHQFILFGLSLELLKFAEQYNCSLKDGIIIETGGTKKNEKKLIKEELHFKLKALFNVKLIFSEYGMAELLSQSYFTNKKYFESPPWKKIIIRDKTNPLNIIQSNKKGCINIIDLANIHSCGFIATNDTGQRVNNGFHIIGRQQGATIRGCDLMT